MTEDQEIASEKIDNVTVRRWFWNALNILGPQAQITQLQTILIALMHGIAERTPQ